MPIIHDGNSLPITETNPLAVSGSVAKKSVVVTPSDATVLTATKGIYIGVAGDVAVTMADGTQVTFVGLAAGLIHPLSVTKVKATGTTATSVLAVY